MADYSKLFNRILFLSSAISHFGENRKLWYQDGKGQVFCFLARAVVIDAKDA